MKSIKYELLQSIIVDEDGVETISLEEMGMPWSEAAEEIAKAEAYDGNYTVYDDGEPEPVVEPSTEEVLDTLLGVS